MIWFIWCPAQGETVEDAAVRRGESACTVAEWHAEREHAEGDGFESRTYHLRHEDGSTWAIEVRVHTEPTFYAGHAKRVES